jgi:benzoylformate decarboxylase
MSPPRGPVFLSLPMNILDEIGSPRVVPPSRIELSNVGVGLKELASGLLRFNRGRTVIVAGNDIAELGLGKAIARVAELIGAPVYGASWPSVNNYSSIDPFWRGSLPTTAKGISETLGRYDCLLGLGGKSLVSIVYTMRDPIPDSIEFYHISEDANDLGYNDAPKLGIFGNVRATLEALAHELEPKVPSAIVKENIESARQQKDILWRGLMERADAAIRGDEKIEPIVAAREVLRPLPDGFLLVDEAPCSNLFTQAMHRSTGGRQYFHNRGGALGWGMPAAIGVSLARDHAPVLCMVGDGSAMYSPQALWSAVHEEVPVVFVVLNNFEYGILKNFMLSQPQYNAKEHGFLAMDICQPKVDFQSLASSMGVESTFVGSHRKISEAVEAALNTGKPHLIEIAVIGVAGK